MKEILFKFTESLVGGGTFDRQKMKICNMYLKKLRPKYALGQNFKPSNLPKLGPIPNPSF